MNTSAWRRARLVSLALCAGVLGGCGGGLLESNEPVPDTYRLTWPDASSPAPTATAPAAATPSTLARIVARPRAASSLDTDRIAVSGVQQKFDYYAAVRWSEPAPAMLQQNLVAMLTRSGQYAAVFAAPGRVPAELLLDIELRRFEADLANAAAPVVHVQVQASLVDNRRAGRVASFVSDAAVTAQANRRADIIAAFDRASAQVLGDVVARVTAATASLPPVQP